MLISPFNAGPYLTHTTPCKNELTLRHQIESIRIENDLGEKCLCIPLCTVNPLTILTLNIMIEVRTLTPQYKCGILIYNNMGF